MTSIWGLSFNFDGESITGLQLDRSDPGWTEPDALSSLPLEMSDELNEYDGAMYAPVTKSNPWSWWYLGDYDIPGYMLKYDWTTNAISNNDFTSVPYPNYYSVVRWHYMKAQGRDNSTYKTFDWYSSHEYGYRQIPKGRIVAYNEAPYFSAGTDDGYFAEEWDSVIVVGGDTSFATGVIGKILANNGAGNRSLDYELPYDAYSARVSRTPTVHLSFFRFGQYALPLYWGEVPVTSHKPMKINQRDDGLGNSGGPGRVGYYGHNGGRSSRITNGGAW